MEGLRQYVISVTTAAIVCGMLTAVLKKGTMQSLVKLLCGFFLGTALASLPSMLILVPCRCLSLAAAFLLKEPDGHVVYLLFSSI